MDIAKLVVRKKNILKRPIYVKDIYTLNYIYPDGTADKLVLYFEKSKLGKKNPITNDTVCISDNRFDRVVAAIYQKYMELMAIELKIAIEPVNNRIANRTAYRYVRINPHTSSNSLVVLGSRQEGYDNRHYRSIQYMRTDPLIGLSTKMSHWFHLTGTGFIIFSCGVISDHSVDDRPYIRPLINYLEVSLNRSHVVSEIQFDANIMVSASMEI